MLRYGLPDRPCAVRALRSSIRHSIIGKRGLGHRAPSQRIMCVNLTARDGRKRQLAISPLRVRMRPSAPRDALGDLVSIGRIPNDGEDVFIVLTSGLTEIGEEFAASEDGIDETETDVILAGAFRGFHPAGADFNGLAEDAEVGLGVGGLGGVGQNIDGRAHRKRLDLALTRLAVLGFRDVPIAGIAVSIESRETILPCDGRPFMGGGRAPEPEGPQQREGPERREIWSEAAARSA